MLSQEDIEDLPDDPDLAIAVIMDLLEQRSGPLMDTNDFGMREARAWWSDVQAHLHENELQKFYPSLTVEPPTDSGEFWEWWHEFYARLRSTRTQIYMARKRNSNSVILTGDSRAQIHTLLNQIRERVQQLDVSIEKRDLIFRLIARLQSEVDRTRTNIQDFFHIMLEISRVAKQVGEDAKPIVDRIRELFGIFSDSDGQPRPRVEGKKTPKIGRKRDDDIPF